MGRSLSFYRDQLGVDLEFGYAGFYASVCRDGCHIHLKCAFPVLRDQAISERDEHIHACITGQSAEAVAARFASAGVPFAMPRRQMPYGTAFYVRDPDGYVHGFVHPRPTLE